MILAPYPPLIALFDMPIKNITDISTVESYSQRPGIRVYKGSEKQTKGGSVSVGADLGLYYRIETNDSRLSNCLTRKYSSEQEQAEIRKKVKTMGFRGWTVPVSEQSVFLEKLHIYLAYDNLYKTYDSYRAKYSTKADAISGLIHKCDGEAIYAKFEIEEGIGGKTKKLISCNDPCPIANQRNAKCPKGCQNVGMLYFYIAELFEMGIYELCVLNAAGETDLYSINNFLHNTVYNLRDTYNRAEYSLNTSKFIPFDLTRKKTKINRPVMVEGKRTGKSTEDYTFAVKLNIDSDWLEWENQYFRAKNAIAAGHEISSQYLSAAYQIDILPPQETVKLINPSWEPTDEDRERVRLAYSSNKWTKESCALMLKKHYQLDSFDKVYSLSKVGFEMLIESLNDEDLSTKYLYQAEDF